MDQRLNVKPETVRAGEKVKQRNLQWDIKLGRVLISETQSTITEDKN